MYVWTSLTTVIQHDLFGIQYCGNLNDIFVSTTVLYKNTKSMDRKTDVDTDFFHIVAWVLQGDTMAQFVFIVCLDNVLRTSTEQIRENGFTADVI